MLFSVPLVQLSGFAFPTRNMPIVLQWFAELFPATHYIRVSRGIYLRGEGPHRRCCPSCCSSGSSPSGCMVLARRALESRS